ncbi:integrin alpha-M-like isoform X2 [Nelusetta ayraudi]|uniref:integrin alpha-M-like isoform X2 n=1 Tax=Nelusetta ayraudi TaxID=303726 RepID=UPI003F72C03D
MDSITTIFFLSVLKAALGFNIDPVPWKSINNNAAGFGYQVVQRRTDVLVSAPLQQFSAKERGQLFKCTTTSCSPLSVQLPEFAVNSSLGLTMTNDPATQNTLVCGPTIPKDCKSITMYNGICVWIDSDDRAAKYYPLSGEECRAEADIAFLMDGSGSVQATDFEKMKEFVINLVRSLQGKYTQFSVSQYSTGFNIHSSFNQFHTYQGWESQIRSIEQIGSGTNTADAIRKVVRYVFNENVGSRPNVKKVMIVITDGESQDPKKLPGAIMEADAKKIVRFTIGVGRAFSKQQAKAELEKIASPPASIHVFQVESFTALDAIKNSLREKIFSIEGSQAAGESLKLEMSQLGFSAAFVPSTEQWDIQMAVVGANEWKGGFVRSTSGEERSSFMPPKMESDSYVGYSMAIAKTQQGLLTIVGAPRYKHRGQVLVVEASGNYVDINPNPEQTGAYFGAVVCAMKVDSDAFTDLILISAPMYIDEDRQGRVYICSVSSLKVDCLSDPPVVLRGDKNEQGRFGSSLAVLPDINADGLNDLAVGAPLENDGHGSIYIFHGMRSVGLTFSQRILGTQSVKHFGMSISSSSFDHSLDNLPDLVVGSKGNIVFLRSKPIVMVKATVSFNPNLIPPQYSDCSTPLQSSAKVCFTMSRHSAVDTARAQINFTFTLDITRSIPLSRAYIRDKERAHSQSVEVTLERPKCVVVNFNVKSCLDDALNALYNELRFSFEGLPSPTNLSPALNPQAQMTSTYPLGFEIDCGDDSKCVDNLKVDFNFSNSSEIRVGIDELMSITVLLENSEENSYNTHVILTYPAGLSYRKLTILQGRIECNSLDSDNGLSRGKTDCTIDKPIFRSKIKASFVVSYGIGTYSQLDRMIFVTANATSENEEHSSLSKPYSMRGISVKYSIFLTFESTLSYNNFTFGYDNVQKAVLQSMAVTNSIRELNITIIIKVPVKLGDKDIWVHTDGPQFPECQRDNNQVPSVTDFAAQIKKDKIVDCSVATCSVFKCNRFMGRTETLKYNFSAIMTSGWIEQIGLKAAVFHLTSTASLEYDKDQYIFFSTGSSNNPPIRKIIAEVEVYPENDFTKEIIGGSLGGLALLILTAVVLYKAGFFKSKYGKMLEENAENEGGGGDGGGGGGRGEEGDLVSGGGEPTE